MPAPSLGFRVVGNWNSLLQDPLFPVCTSPAALNVTSHRLALLPDTAMPYSSPCNVIPLSSCCTVWKAPESGGTKRCLSKHLSLRSWKETRLDDLRFAGLCLVTGLKWKSGKIACLSLKSLLYHQCMASHFPLLFFLKTGMVGYNRCSRAEFALCGFDAVHDDPV